MTPDETALVLTKCAAIDQRTIGRADVLGWHEIVGTLPLADALEAVKRWYATHRDRIMPVDVLEIARQIRNDRAASQAHPIRELPSRFEADQVRDDRVRQGVVELAARLSIPAEVDDSPHGRALARARRERGRRPVPAGQSIRKRASGEVKTAPPPWADRAVAEQTAANALHEAGRDCGKSACPSCGRSR